MSADRAVFAFDGYRLRPAADQDRALAQQWIDADPDHAGRMGGPYWTEQSAGVDCHVLEDQAGVPLFFFRIERVARVHIQFGPAASAADRERNRLALDRGMRWLAMAIGAAGYLEMIFSSSSKLLRRFTTGKLGFNPAPDTLTRRLVRLPPRPYAAPDSQQQGVGSQNHVASP